ncbi:hypothetical protein EMIHUDRAFT_368192 [Emiliania huxleyi CCMP1516]|uniref:Uncharacterized protein n=2 Tax=Emiliania huxleyi TaxID=2903 RepID=A0A0D3J7A3_EMIH1|nr:hypothetical protein EMIHUDRAFT_360345 [Emiliania huxleyi CCMP1516]XP_005771817.1 hypothetical protein EMIHUDRAFT_369474 [Emiliania huxleyi CCMP1516]XP_005775761.1 hypothetical protein EMIHUDRAFT_368192 [Emiliania huxleyi CCMP1516]EOD04431.1 hypothetical protein EMIHUDRAFT_360345 [Emiliania huxleyi CCMP1516]EOD19388.1 hypothetical protein EMIHUDRAFT_369474 [Emiliania huxleyi CCMP1516]EOD23332.1 hypothetical protein EMIHUDRAFT_368192 [Emiliania huxleyi CCMP1516]|eukprot:XP_005756860.1 hypothetical protein EMIHUDRAFT_360345 [Emiliania huxleyi CCMP1516]
MPHPLRTGRSLVRDRTPSPIRPPTPRATEPAGCCTCRCRSPRARSAITSHTPPKH